MRQTNVYTKTGIHTLFFAGDAEYMTAVRDQECPSHLGMDTTCIAA